MVEAAARRLRKSAECGARAVGSLRAAQRDPELAAGEGYDAAACECGRLPSGAAAETCEA